MLEEITELLLCDVHHDPVIERGELVGKIGAWTRLLLENLEHSHARLDLLANQGPSFLIMVSGALRLRAAMSFASLCGNT